MTARLLGHDAISGAAEYFDFDDASETATLGRRSRDVEPILDRNKRLANHTDGWTSPARDMRLVASIPVDVAYIWLQRYGVRVWDRNHEAAVRRLLNDSEWRYLKCQEVII